MIESQDLINRADNLMQRKRVFVATTMASQTVLEAAATAQPPLEEDEVPLLTEVVDISAVSGDAPPHAFHSSRDPALESMARELSREVQLQLAASLPGLIETASRKLAEELDRSLRQLTDQIVRDFVDRRLPPPPEP